ncbi:alpha-1,2-mannosidase, putative [Mucilaginibacter mallensis]|uniref:Alpha-1,2-mannosidase, putative n=2 Tax=Mucilaginibacter mallensis TaxID=652787 RepID=A0A1H1SKH9_MUCMA|nr:GH92 family glycosyl hydrolase [Mucilaginibacter mallensis]SDS47859.1 alpha-1,2-mannosidase, putative [Mucilaginibacter mallensis]
MLNSKSKLVSASFIRALLCLLFFVCCLGMKNTRAQNISSTNDGTGNLKYIDPRIGNVGQLLQPTRPTVQVPNQMIRMYPERNDYIDDQISSFPLTIVSHRLGEVFALKPWNKPVTTNAWKEKQTFDHDLEITRPWYYSTYLIDDEITVEFTAGKKTGIYRFTFPGNKQDKNLLFDLYNNGAGSWKFINGNSMEGTETYHDDIKIYMYGEFNTDGQPGTALDNGLNKGSREIAGKGVKSWITFSGNSPDTIYFRYAISYISPEQARANFKQEIAGKSFNDIKTAGEKAWDKAINNIRVEGGTEAQRRSFYTAYYRCNERMVDITEDGKYYSGFDKKIHDTTRPFYVDDWTWDTYLALHPLRAIVNPAMEQDMLNSYVSMYTQGGWMPTFPVLFGDHACMNAFHSTIMMLDDYRKGLRNFDVNKAYEGMMKNATSATMLPWRNGPKGSLEDFYYAKGYYPALKVGETETIPEVNPIEHRQAVAVTLGASYDDWALSQMAGELGKVDDQKKFSIRANNYKNLWDNNMKMFMPKDSSGNWIKIDPKFDGGEGGRDYYDENNGWTYLWQVQEDVPGLINLMGGKKQFEARLDQLFREPLGRSKYAFWAKFPDATGLVGQYSLGNEPSFHIPYLYNFTNSPWKTQKRIRFLLDVWFKDNIFGIPGDEDGGGMSAFVVFSSMGFYPITPGLPVYTIGSPVFSKVTIDLPGGKQFRMIANNCSVINKYIQSAKMNGQPLNKPWFTHEQLINGGTLELEMGPKPNKSWGVE